MEGKELFHNFEPEYYSGNVVLGIGDTPATCKISKRKLKSNVEQRWKKKKDERVDYKESLRRICWGIRLS